MKALLAFFLLFLISAAAVAQQGVGGNVSGPIPPAGRYASISGTFNAGDITLGKSSSSIGDTLFFGTNGGISMSGGGIPAYNNCFWNDVDSCTTENIRMRERVFFGDAVLLTDNRNGFAVFSSTWFGTLPVAQYTADLYLVRDAQIVSMGDRGTIGVTGAIQASLGDNTVGTPAIGVAGYVYNDTTVVNANGWGGYFQGTHAPNGVAATTFGVEIDVRNTTSTNTVPNPYSIGQGDIAVWLGAGAGLGSGTGAPNPSAAAIATTANSQTFNVGLLFRDGSLTKDGSNNSNAIQMGQGATIQWYIDGSNVGAYIRSTVSAAGDDMSIVFANNQMLLQGPSGAALLNVNASPSLTLPTLAFPTCGTNCGWFAPSSNAIELVVAGAKIIDYGVTSPSTLTLDTLLQAGGQSITNVNNLTANNAAGYQLVNAAASSTVPTLAPNKASTSTGFGAQAAGNISAIVASTEVARFVAGGLILPTVTTGTPAASLCIDASNNVIKKTTTGACI